MRSKKKVTDQEIMGYDNVPVDVAASYIDIGAQALRLSLQDGNCPFGFISSKESETAFCGERFRYNISPGLLVAYKRGTLQCMRMNEMKKLLKNAVDDLLREIQRKEAKA